MIMEFSSLEAGKKMLVIKRTLKALSFRKNGSRLADLILVEPGDTTR